MLTPKSAGVPQHLHVLMQRAFEACRDLLDAIREAPPHGIDTNAVRFRFGGTINTAPHVARVYATVENIERKAASEAFLARSCAERLGDVAASTRARIADLEAIGQLAVIAAYELDELYERMTGYRMQTGVFDGIT